MKRLDEIPLVPEDEPGDPLWYPLQHHFGFTAFGVNVYTAPEAGGSLIGNHDEADSEQEELYLVTAGSARFTIDGEETLVPAGSVVAITDPRRAAYRGRRRAGHNARRSSEAAVLLSSNRRGKPEHFTTVPTAE